MKTAILLGATGLTGSTLLDQLLQDPRYTTIKLFSRSPIGLKNDKIEEHLVDMQELDKYASEFTADEVFCCIGTTQAKTPDEELYYKIDHGIPVTAAKIAKNNHISRFLVISSLGADATSSFFYNRTKGAMERDVLGQSISETYIFRPSLIGGERAEKRPFEGAWKKLMGLLNHIMIGPLRKFRSIKPDAIAKAMVYVANHKYSDHILESTEIQKIADSY